APLPAPLRRRRPRGALLRQPLPGRALGGHRELRRGDPRELRGPQDQRPRASRDPGAGAPARRAAGRHEGLGRDGDRSPLAGVAAGWGGCRRVWLGPPPVAYPPALEAISRADMVVLGPGSLFTSVLPHLAIPAVAEAVRSAPGLRVYVGNVMTQSGETDGFDAADHLAAVLEAIPGGVDVAVVHDGPLDERAIAAYAAQGQHPVPPTVEALERMGVRAVTAELAAAGHPVRHPPPPPPPLL